MSIKLTVEASKNLICFTWFFFQFFQYNFKVETNEKTYLHLQFHLSYTDDLELQGVQSGKKLDDEIERFEPLKGLWNKLTPHTFLGFLNFKYYVLVLVLVLVLN